jgi:hypothetical protein
MKAFEIHITGARGINDEFDNLGIKNIVVDLLRPDKTILRTEYMCSMRKHFDSYESCKVFVDTLVEKLNSKVVRVKIESMFYPEYVDKSIYIESHWKTNEISKYPMSRNAKSNKILFTDRTYVKENYQLFITTYKNVKDVEIELCLYDDYIREDFDWFKLYE